MADVVRVLIADDHPVVREGLHNLLQRAGFEVVAQVASAEEAITAMAGCHPDVVVLDLSMPGMGGTQATRRIRALYPRVPVLALTAFAENNRILEAVDAGVSGYMLKDDDPAELIAAIRAVSEGGAPFSPRVAGALVEARGRQRSEELLTAREFAVLELVTEGLSNKEIAARLGITEGTVKAHLGSAFRRIGVRRRSQAALWMRARSQQRPT